MAPPMTEPTHRAMEKPDTLDTAAAMGVMRVMVPTDVPIAVDTKQEATNSTATEAPAGVTDSRK